MRDIIRAVNDARLLRPAFKDLGTWSAWLVYLRALFGLGIEDAEELGLFRECTGLESPPSGPVRESFAIVGRRGGKSFISAIVGCYIGGSRDWLKVLGRGERAQVFILAVDQNQARIIRHYCQSILESSPTLSRLIMGTVRDEIRLKNGATIAVKTSSFRSVRGYSIACAVLEEVGFWRSEESAEPDIELIRAVRPALETVPDSLLLGISTPYAKRGALFEAFRDHYGKPGGPLIWRAPSLRMNPTLSPDSITARLQEDPEGAASEWLAEFRRDISSFIPADLIQGLIIPGRRELPVQEGTSYFGFTDPSGGSEDSFALAVCHRSPEGRVILDAVRVRRPPFSAEAVVSEFAETLKTYRITEVRGDRYAGEWPRERFRSHGIEYKVSERTASEIFLDVLPALTSGAVELLDDKRLRVEFSNLERRSGRTGRDYIGHGPGSHDDLAVCIAGACLMGASTIRAGRVFGGGRRLSGPPDPPGGFQSKGRVYSARTPKISVERIVRSTTRGGAKPDDD